MGFLTNFDYSFIAIYFILLIWIGYHFSKHQKHDDFLIAERNLGSLSTMATMNASKTGSILMTYVSFTYLWGFSAIWYFVGALCGFLIFIPFATKLKENSNQEHYTLAHYFRYNYGKRSAAVASGISIFIMIGALIMNLIAGAKIFMFFSGLPYWICSIIMILVVLMYIFMSGFKAVVKTDILQYLAILSIFALLTFLMFDGSLIPASEWRFFQTDLMTIIGFFVVGSLYPFAAPELWQRVYSAKGKKQVKEGIILSVIIYGFVVVMLAMMALTVKVKFPNVDPDLALVHGFANLLPTGLLGLSVVLLFAAIMSSVDTYLFTGSSALIQDFFHISKKETVRYIKRAILVVGVAATLLAILIQDLITGAYIVVAAIVTLGTAVVSTWIYSKIKENVIIFTLVFGLAAAGVYTIINLIKGNLQPFVVTVSLSASLAGLILGLIYSKLQ